MTEPKHPRDMTDAEFEAFCARLSSLKDVRGMTPAEYEKAKREMFLTARRNAEKESNARICKTLLKSMQPRDGAVH